MRSRRKLSVAAIIGFAMISAELTVPVTFASSAGAASWTYVSGDCVNGGVSGWSFYTECYDRKKLGNDGNTTYDFFAHRMTISGNATDGKYLGRLWVEQYPGEKSAAQSWYTADPFQPDAIREWTSNCASLSYEIGVGVQGVASAAFSVSVPICNHEYINPKLYSDAGHHAGIWYAPPGSRASSGVVKKSFSMVLVKVANKKTATWRTTRYGACAYSFNGSADASGCGLS